MNLEEVILHKPMCLVLNVGTEEKPKYIRNFDVMSPKVVDGSPQIIFKECDDPRFREAEKKIASLIVANADPLTIVRFFTNLNKKLFVTEDEDINYFCHIGLLKKGLLNSQGARHTEGIFLATSGFDLRKDAVVSIEKKKDFAGSIANEFGHETAHLGCEQTAALEQDLLEKYDRAARRDINIMQKKLLETVRELNGDMPPRPDGTCWNLMKKLKLDPCNASHREQLSADIPFIIQAAAAFSDLAKGPLSHYLSEEECENAAAIRTSYRASYKEEIPAIVFELSHQFTPEFVAALLPNSFALARGELKKNYSTFDWQLEGIDLAQAHTGLLSRTASMDASEVSSVYRTHP